MKKTCGIFLMFWSCLATAQSAFQQARQLEESGHFENAMQVLDSCYSKEHHLDSVFFYRSLFCIKNNKAKQAEKAMARLKEAYPASPLTSYVQALIHFQEKNYARSIEYFSAALQKGLFRHKVLFNRSVAFGMLEDYPAAIADLDQLIKEHPAQAEAYYSRAYWLEFAGKNGQAIEDYKRTIELDPQHFDAYLGLAYLYKLQDENEKACDALNKAVRAGSQIAGEMIGNYCQ